MTRFGLNLIKLGRAEITSCCEWTDNYCLTISSEPSCIMHNNKTKEQQVHLPFVVHEEQGLRIEHQMSYCGTIP